MKDRKPWSFCETPEEKCTMNYCDENGCQNRKRNLVKDNANNENGNHVTLKLTADESEEDCRNIPN